MVKLSALKNSSWRRSKKVILRLKVLEQLHEKQAQELTTSLDKHVKNMDSKSETIREEMSRFGAGMTNFNLYCDQENKDVKNDTIVFPLVRTREDWESRPCWIRQHGGSEKCPHFPCRTFTSYHFIFRNLPKFIEDAAEESVRRSRCHTKAEFHATAVGDDDEIGKKRNEDKLPPIFYSENMTAKEWTLKMITEKKRLQNEAENKPKDRNVNYGTPTSVRQLQMPVRPVVRRIDTT